MRITRCQCQSRFSEFLRCFCLTAVAFLAASAVPQNLAAQADPQAAPHVVTPGDLQKATVDASRTRHKNLDTLDRFFSSDQAQHALQTAHIDPQQVKKAVAGLSDDELAQLAARAQKAQNDFAAGNMNDRDLLILLVCIAALILVIVAVH